ERAEAERAELAPGLDLLNGKIDHCRIYLPISEDFRTSWPVCVTLPLPAALGRGGRSRARRCTACGANVNDAHRLLYMAQRRKDRPTGAQGRRLDAACK